MTPEFALTGVLADAAIEFGTWTIVIVRWSTRVVVGTRGGATIVLSTTPAIDLFEIFRVERVVHPYPIGV